MILVYSDSLSSRLIYILNVVFKYVLGVNYKTTVSLIDFENYKGPKINYSKKNLENSVRIIPVKFLFQNSIQQQNLDVNWIDEVPYFFKTKDGQYDVLASCFWMITRYEEYLPFTPDHHNRFKAEDSLAYKQGFLKIPVVNVWVQELQQKLNIEFPNFIFPQRHFSTLNTLDIDTAYFSKGKGFFYFVGGFLKDIIKKRKENIEVKWSYLKTQKDVYDTYDFIESVSKNIKTHYFFLLGNKSEFDSSVKHTRKCLKKLIQQKAKNHSVGIHPSYVSNQKPELISKEIKRLEKLVGNKITSSRQHFLKLEFPKTYENLIKNGVRVDYSMGFASQVGFRAGICNAYPFYNLKTETQESFWIVPFQVMDGTLNQYLQLSPNKAIDEIKELIDQVKKVDGLFVSLWHNSSLSEKFGWQGWRKVYQEMLLLLK
ncbi:hypothetical protein FHR24_000536 [Wenyingzhuangia heitensis]|uniref:DUF7033 domain-containing protein n=1 Tax=Wenyingzhuangia heitensis TaxID=1487859 RepID=A0ABX0U5L1_9FLAO|nr:polysaccharide deacetylase family protein [Wenyingzhuangia heitensis]NIJ44097.1 hypothetical protein [Wenyingzhuangia heitensis]